MGKKNTNHKPTDNFIEEDTDSKKSPNNNLTTAEIILNDSRITPTGNGDPDGETPCVQPSAGQKWWAAILMGILFFIFSSPIAYYVTSSLTTSIGGLPLMYGPGPSLAGLLVHSILFTIIIRIILW